MVFAAEDLGLFAVERAQLPDQVVLEPGGLVVLGGLPGFEADLVGLAVGEDDRELADMVGGGPVPDRPHPGGVQADHPPDRPRLGVAGVRADPAAEGAEFAVQSVEDDARLHDDVIGTDFDDPAEVATEINDQARSQGLARQAGPSASGMKRDRVFGGVANQGDQIIKGPRDHHAERVDLVQAGVVGVSRPPDWLEQQLPRDDPPEIIMNPSPIFVHGTFFSSNWKSAWRELPA